MTDFSIEAKCMLLGSWTSPMKVEMTFETPSKMHPATVKGLGELNDLGYLNVATSEHSGAMTWKPTDKMRAEQPGAKVYKDLGGFSEVIAFLQEHSKPYRIA